MTSKLPNEYEFINFYLDAEIDIKGNYISIFIAALYRIINSEKPLLSRCETNGV